MKRSRLSRTLKPNYAMVINNALEKYGVKMGSDTADGSFLLEMKDGALVKFSVHPNKDKSKVM